MPLIDSHAHLTAENYSDSAIDAMLQRAAAAGVAAIVNICTDKNSLERALQLKIPHNAAAIPPHDVHLEEGLEEYFSLISETPLIAIGETGLDQVNARGSLKEQIIWFKRHIHLAQERNIPLIVHCREAFAPFFEVIDEEQYKGPLLLHCFTGTQEEADELVRRGFFLSFSGIVTFKKSLALQAIAKTAPLKNIMIETDSPWLAPQSKRGQINEPAYVAEVAAFLADLRHEPVEEMIFKNTKDFFSL